MHLMLSEKFMKEHMSKISYIHTNRFDYSNRLCLQNDVYDPGGQGGSSYSSDQAGPGHELRGLVVGSTFQTTLSL